MAARLKGTDRWVAYALLTVLGVAYALWAGKDLNWDLINYHFYAGFSVFNDRLDQDFFPATSPSYLVPYAYAPLYLMVHAGWDDRIIVALLALMAVPALWGTWEIGARLAPASIYEDRRTRLAVAYASALLAFLCPVFLLQLGSSFIDAPTAALVIWGYLFVLRALPHGDWRPVALGAALLGIAAAFKQTNVLFALAGTVLLFGTTRHLVRRFVVYVLAGLSVGVAVLGPWAWMLYKEFGNPLFPSLNQYFRSPAAPIDGGGSIHYRFIPDSLSEALLRPLWMMSPESGVYTEPPAPDARFMALFLLLAVAFGVICWRIWRLKRVSLQQDSGGASASLLALTAVFLVSWVLWLMLSGNGRYFIAMALLTGPLIAGWIFFISANFRWRVYSLGAVVMVTTALAVMGSMVRWSPVPWSGRYFDVRVSSPLKESPALFISLDTQPFAFIAPFLHRDSSFVSIVGMQVLGPGLPGWERIERLFSRHNDTVRFLLPVVIGKDKKMVRPRQDYMKYLTARLGFEVDVDACEPIELYGLISAQPDINPGPSGSLELTTGVLDMTLYAACVGRRNEALRAEYLAQMPAVNALFDAVVVRCPRLFLPVGVTEGIDKNWRRFSVGTDMVLALDDDRITYRRFGMTKPRLAGTVEEIRAGKINIECSRKRDPLLTFETL